MKAGYSLDTPTSRTGIHKARIFLFCSLLSRRFVFRFESIGNRGIRYACLWTAVNSGVPVRLDDDGAFFRRSI